MEKGGEKMSEKKVKQKRLPNTTEDRISKLEDNVHNLWSVINAHEHVFHQSSRWDAYHRLCIKRMLKRRGLVPDWGSDWVIHGTHGPDMPHVVYAGTAFEKANKDNTIFVAIWPKRVYQIEDISKWAKVGNQNAIPVGSSHAGLGRIKPIMGFERP
jgi:hypothetical protein